MKKYVNLLLIGFLVFIIGLISLNFELVNYTYVEKLPDFFESEKDSYTLDIKENQRYVFAKAKYNKNITFNKRVNNNLKDEIYIEVEHMTTNNSSMIVKNTKNGTAVVFSNELDLDFDDMKKIPSLVINCIKEKKVYNYNLLKYSNVTIYGNEEVLDGIEIEDYE